MSKEWLTTDKSIYLVHNFTDVRAQIDVDRKNGTGSWVRLANDSITSTEFDADEWQAGQHVIYNDTETREVHIILNGKDRPGNTQLETQFKLTGHRCVGPCVEEVDFGVAGEDRTRYWSVAEDWGTVDEEGNAIEGVLPQEGENVHVLPGWNMVYDLDEPSPVYELVRVNGNLTFATDKDLHFRAKHIFVRGGNLTLGTLEEPLTNDVQIELFGAKNDAAMVYDNAVEAGNKLIAVTGRFEAYGIPRGESRMSRLTQPAQKGEDTFFVESGLDWVEGDRLGMLPTSYQWDAFDEVFVVSYDAVTGEVVADHPLNFYHYGRETSTGDLYNGLDMRGEVILLTRNVRIRGEDIESWGGQIVAGFMIEEDFTFRYGEIYMDNVEVYNMSQIDTFKSAIRWENNVNGQSSVTNCAIHSGFGWALRVQTSRNVNIQNNTIWNFRPIGVAIQTSDNVTIDSNVLGQVVSRTTFTAQSTCDMEGGFSICAYPSPTPCKDLTITNNIAGGIVYAGFVTPGHECGEAATQTWFRDNVAHSSESIASGEGAVFFPNPAYASQSQCYEASHFSAYKCSVAGVNSFSINSQTTMSDITLVDNHFGFSVLQTCPGDYEPNEIVLKNNHIYGESISPDCPHDGGFCTDNAKIGLVFGSSIRGGKVPHNPMLSPRPFYKIKTDACWYGGQRLENNIFADFEGNTQMGNQLSTFDMNPSSADFNHAIRGSDNQFKNVDDTAFGNFYDPPQKWANVKDCGDFPCTGPWNVLLMMKDTTFSGNKPSFSNSASDNFQLIADNPGFAPHVPTCNKLEENNMWLCEQPDMGMLVWESLDADSRDRSMYPVYVGLDGTDMNNKVNSFMDHVWDGFYAGQVRESRFVSTVYAPKGSVYNLTFAGGSPAKKMRFELRSDSDNVGMTVRIPYPSAQARKIIKDGEDIDMNQWDETIRGYGEVQQSFCGENRYMGVVNIMEFYITPGCTLEVAPRNAIQTMVRMEWTVDEFFSGGGTTAFIDRVAGSLGIHASTIKVVSVYEGSLVVNYGIENDNEQELEEARAAQTEAFATGAVDLGAPVLDVEQTVSSDATTKAEATIAEDSSEDALAAAITATETAQTSSNDAAAEDQEEEEVESIVSGGVVTAADYEPIVITVVSEASEESEVVDESEEVVDASESETEEEESETYREGSSYQRDSNGDVLSDTEVYIPDVSVIEETTVIESEVTTQITVEQEIIVQEEEVDTNGKSTIIVGVTASVVVLLLIAYFMRVLYNRMNAEALEKVAIKAKQEEIHMTKMKSVKRSRQKKDNNVDQVDEVIEEVRKHGDSNMKMIASRVEDDEFEEQYNPLHDFAVFNVGNNRLGGNQTLQEKMNLADESSGEDEGEDEDDGCYEVPAKQQKTKADYVLAGDQSQSQDSMMVDPDRKTNSALSSDKNDNVNVVREELSLPEDAEINQSAD